MRTTISKGNLKKLLKLITIPSTSIVMMDGFSTPRGILCCSLVIITLVVIVDLVLSPYPLAWLLPLSLDRVLSPPLLSSGAPPPSPRLATSFVSLCVSLSSPHCFLVRFCSFVLGSPAGVLPCFLVFVLTLFPLYLFILLFLFS